MFSASTGYVGGPTPRGSGGNGTGNNWSQAPNPIGGLGWGPNITNGIADSREMQVGPGGSMGSNMPMAKDTSNMVPDDTQDKIYRLKAQIILRTLDQDKLSGALGRLLREVFVIATPGTAPEDVQAVVRDFVTVEIPQLTQGTTFNNAGRVINIGMHRTVAKYEKYDETFEVAQDFTETELGRDIVDIVSTGLMDIVMEKLLTILMGLLIENQSIPRPFVYSTDRVKFSPAWKAVLSNIGVVNSNPVNLFPTLQTQSDLASRAAQCLPANCVIADRITLAAANTHSGDNVHAQSGGSDGNWGPGSLTRGKVPSSGLSFYEYPLGAEENNNASGLMQSAIVWHSAWFKGSNLSDPVTTIDRIFTGQDKKGTIDMETFVDGLRGYFGPGEDDDFLDYNDENHFDQEAIEAVKLRDFIPNSPFYTEEGVKITCYGDIPSKHLSDGNVLDIVDGAVRRGFNSTQDFDSAVGVLRRFVAMADRGAMKTLEDYQPEKTDGSLSKSRLPQLNTFGFDGANAAVIAAGKGVSGAGVQRSKIHASPVGFQSYSGATVASLLILDDGTQPWKELVNHLAVFSDHCNRINEMYGEPIKDFMDPTGNNDLRNVFFLALIATNHTPVYHSDGKEDVSDKTTDSGIATSLGGLSNAESGLIASLTVVDLDGVTVSATTTISSAPTLEASVKRLREAIGTGFVGHKNAAHAPTIVDLLTLIYLIVAKITGQKKANVRIDDFEVFETAPEELHKFNLDRVKTVIKQVLTKVNAAMGSAEFKKIAPTLTQSLWRTSEAYVAQMQASVMVDGTDAFHASLEIGAGKIKRTGFVVSWGQMNKAAAKSVYFPSNPANMANPFPRTSEGGATTYLTTSLEKRSAALLAALVSSTASYKGTAPSVTAKVCASTTLHHRTGVLIRNGKNSQKLAALAYLFMRHNWRSLKHLASNKISLPWTLGGMFPINMQGLPIIMVPKGGFVGINHVTDAWFQKQPDTRNGKSHIRAYFMTMALPNAKAHVYPFAHITGFGDSDNDKVADNEWLGNQNMLDALGYIPILGSHGAPTKASYLSLTGMNTALGVDNDFDENDGSDPHYALAPWVVGRYKLSPSKFYKDGMQPFGSLDPTTIIVNSAPMGYTFITADSNSGAVAPKVTYGECPIVDNSLEGTYLTNRVKSGASIFLN